MRTLIVILIGLGVLATLEVISRITGKKLSKPFNAPKLFMVLWSLFIVVDIYFGVQAGYGLVEELMIHSVILIVPAAAAWWFIKR